MKFHKLFYAAALGFAPALCSAQGAALHPVADTMISAPAPAPPVASPKDSPAPLAAVTRQPPSALPSWEAKIDRYADFSAASFSFRYRSETAVDDYRFFANGQQSYGVDGRLKLDPAARYTINYRLSSGRLFNWAYSDEIGDDFHTRGGPASIAALNPAVTAVLFTGIAEGYPITSEPSRGWEVGARQLYISATPVDGLTFEYGGLGIERGENSEITSYDDDGYLTGERIRLHHLKHMYFDEIAVTYAYEGDIFQPNFINRTQHLKKSNYHQFLFAKQFGSRVAASTDYTFDNATHTIREAALIKVPESRLLDSVRAEFYERLNTHDVGTFPFKSGAGFGLTGSRTLYGKLTLNGGYEQVDLNYGANEALVLGAVFGFTLNGDSYNTGKHVFTHANLEIAPGTHLTAFYIHQTTGVPADKFSFVKEGWNVGMTFDLKKLAQKSILAM